MCACNFLRVLWFYLLVCCALCLPVRLVIAASHDSGDQAKTERQWLFEESIAQASSTQLYTSARDFIRQSCQQVTTDGFSGDTINLPTAWQAYSDSSDDSLVQPATEPVERRGQQVGTRYIWRSGLLDEVQLSVLGTPARPVLTLQIGDEFPVLRLLVRGDCSVVNAQRVEYRHYKSCLLYTSDAADE